MIVFPIACAVYEDLAPAVMALRVRAMTVWENRTTTVGVTATTQATPA